MTISGFLLVLTAAFCHAGWNFFVKRINGGPELVWLFSIVSVGLYLPVAVFIYVTEKPDIGWFEFAFIVASAILHLGYFLLLQQGYRRGDLSLVYPTARATGPFLSTTFAVILLGETMTPQIGLGAVLVIGGVVMLTGGFGRSAKNMRTSLAFGIGAGLLIGGYTVWDAYTVAVLLVPPLLLDYASSVGRAIILTPVGLKRLDLVKGYWRDHRLGVLAIAVLNPLAYILVLYAMTFTPVVYVAPVREISVLLTVILGSVVLGEGDLKRRLIWVATILSGVVLLTTG